MNENSKGSQIILRIWNLYFYTKIYLFIGWEIQENDIGLNDYIKLPRIVVLGLQSAGKSSQLEHNVEIDFLPSGSGVVTRRLLELGLSYSQKDVCTAKFVEEIKGKKFTNFDENYRQGSGTSKNIIDKPIILAVTGPNCPDLTLVDLPENTEYLQWTNQKILNKLQQI